MKIRQSCIAFPEMHLTDIIKLMSLCVSQPKMNAAAFTLSQILTLLMQVSCNFGIIVCFYGWLAQLGRETAIGQRVT